MVSRIFGKFSFVHGLNIGISKKQKLLKKFVSYLSSGRNAEYNLLMNIQDIGFTTRIITCLKT